MKIEVNLDEVKRVYLLLEEIQDMIHQPLNYGDSSRMEAFASKHYPEIKDLYYNVVWNWLPKHVQEEITKV